MTTDADRVSLYVCPRCLGPLAMRPAEASCRSCGKSYARHPDGFLDLRVDGAVYADWLTDAEQSARWEAVFAPNEAAGAQHMMERYLIPLLHQLGLADGARVLSVGCGGGWDVETLTSHGYSAWGVDNGGRVRAWNARSCPNALSISDALQLPFPSGAFDLAFAEGVIEHIGYGGDTPQLLPDWQARQEKFARECMRVTKPGGYVLMACPNRLFPIDFFHGGRPFHAFSIRPHSPFESFLLSQGDIRRLFSEQAEWVKPLSLKGFFNLERLSGESGLLHVGVRTLESAFKVLPERFWGTAMSPYIVILIKKQGKRED